MFTGTLMPPLPETQTGCGGTNAKVSLFQEPAISQRISV
jgi:hypothetical protein